MKLQIVLPSLKVSGGVSEALKLAKDFEAIGAKITVVSMWNSREAVSSLSHKLHKLSNWNTNARLALFQLPILVGRFFRWIKSHDSNCCNWIFTHYSTIPLALFVPPDRRWFYVQGLEWKFLESNFINYLLRLVILSVYRRSKLIAANSYLEGVLKSEGLQVLVTIPIWADPRFEMEENIERNIDVLMVLRKGGCKRLDLYFKVIEWFEKNHPSLRVAIITTEDEIAKNIHNKVKECHIRPSGINAMRSIYCRSKLFFHLSEHEGFALPPLEAMGSGCVPICRNSGGPQVYMTYPFEELLFPLEQPVDTLCYLAVELLADSIRLQNLSVAARKIFRNRLSATQQNTSLLESIFSDDSFISVKE